MHHLFISDVHLGAFPDREEEKIEKDLCKLIRFCKTNGYQIHILGDLFDYWMEYPNRRPQIGKQVLHELTIYNREITPVTYITGNHDNWTYGYFKSLGFNVKKDFHRLDERGNQLFLHHGDGLSDKSFGLQRPLLHRILRNKLFIKIYQTVLPAKTGLRLMKWFSDYSRKNSTIDPAPLNRWSEKFLKNSDYNAVISGHDHIPRQETFSFGTYINLGTFFQHRTVALYTNSEIKLVRWDSSELRFQPFTTKKN